MTTQTDYGIVKHVALPYDKAVERVISLLKDEGFGVLTEIDIKAKFLEKLGVDFRKYVILGACNPPLAYRALQSEPFVGLLLPCNVVVWEEREGECVVAAIDPDIMAQVVGDNPVMKAVAHDAKKRLQKALKEM